MFSHIPSTFIKHRADKLHHLTLTLSARIKWAVSVVLLSIINQSQIIVGLWMMRFNRYTK